MERIIDKLLIIVCVVARENFILTNFMMPFMYFNKLDILIGDFYLNLLSQLPFVSVDVDDY